MPLTVTLLSLCQALLVSGNILLIAVSPLIGSNLAPNAAWSTAPVATQWLGLMCATIPASLIMGRLGRKRGFMLGNLMGLIGVAVAAQALIDERFFLFMLGTWLIGIGIGFGQLYRFAAVEAAPLALRDRAIGLVMGGGVLAAFFGPWLARVSRELAETPFLGSFLGLGVLYLVALVILSLTRLPPPDVTHGEGQPRPLGEIMRQPLFIVAVVSALIGYGVMNLAMTATPLAMASAGFHFDHVATTIQWHVLAMFLPSFVTGHLTARFGTTRMIVTGCALLMGCAVVAQLEAGITGFYVALILLGLGWNFTFLPATGLLTESYRPIEKARTQAANEFLVFSTVALTAWLAGPLVSTLGWSLLNALLIPLSLVPIALLTWQRLVRRGQRPHISG
ncbi:major facilitator transporter [Litchfieldella anticariensis FP35 = DSM 16096]|uniref:Major facilitator transporter n=1 Tax=Litchfieldella anticariensis (strain DSM 16096 / CECT 5854 / CIP 108499 / LMG 22089 / FP35) TaxID=1121939 RepID=S2L4C0_LITA3|nr:MFS transporter [Halomonas anticariensis]EPC02564.1 major facilitator transporter [Halomonas anticariensis FP35 = DSM 16096]